MLNYDTVRTKKVVAASAKASYFLETCFANGKWRINFISER